MRTPQSELEEIGRPFGLTAREVEVARGLGMSLSTYKAMKQVANADDHRRVEDEDAIRLEVRRELLAEQERTRLANEPSDEPPAAPTPTETASYISDDSAFEPRGLTAEQAEMAERLGRSGDEYLRFAEIRTIGDYDQAHDIRRQRP